MGTRMLSFGSGYFMIEALMAFIGKAAFAPYITPLKTVYISAGDVERVKKLFLDSGHDIKDIKFLELKADGS